jgi:hypothetical protein
MGGLYRKTVNNKQKQKYQTSQNSCIFKAEVMNSLVSQESWGYLLALPLFVFSPKSKCLCLRRPPHIVGLVVAFGLHPWIAPGLILPFLSFYHLRCMGRSGIKKA